MPRKRSRRVLHSPMAEGHTEPETPPRGGGALARPHSSLGMAQRRGILATKASQPLLTDSAIAKQFGVSRQAVTATLAALNTDMQAAMRTYADEVGEAYLSAVLSSAADGKYQGARAWLIDSAAIPRAGSDNRTLSITVSAPPGTPGYSAADAPPMLAEVYDTPAGPPLPAVRDDES
jgi:hypothetical protein